MADGMTTTGLTALRAAVETFPAAVTAAQRTVAGRIADAVLARARANLAAKTHGTGATAAAITVTEDAANRQFLVTSVAPRGRPANLVLWLEHGTVKMSAIRYMRDAADALRRQYQQEMQQASETVMRQTFRE